MNISECTVLVSSCDAYEELWEPFFKLYNRAWSNNTFPIVLNTESKKFEKDDLEVKSFCLYAENEKVPWGKRLKETLKKIDTEYILFFLDDFWIDGEIDEREINECIRRMNEDRTISVFSFMETFEGSYDDKKFAGFERRKLVAKYRFNCQAALWRRKHLIQYLRDYESPWEWEVYGNWRSYRYFWRKFYSRKAESKQTIPYIFSVNGYAHGGLVLVSGKWYLPLLEYFENKYNIEVDKTTRACMTEAEFMKRFETPVNVERPKWKERLMFLQGAYHKFLFVKNIIIHFKHLI